MNMPSQVKGILDRALSGERLSVEDCTHLLQSHDIAAIGAAADEIRQRRHPKNVVTYIIDRNINYTSVCNVVCTFCAFYRRPGAPDTYVRTVDEICAKIEETIALGGTGVLMQGGLHPDFGIEWYEDLLRTLHAKYPDFQLHCFSPPEIHNIHLISGDRKSTRLNSSHLVISYAVFCLKKKNRETSHTLETDITTNV